MTQLHAEGWFVIKLGDRLERVASVKGVEGLDPRTLQGEVVLIDDTAYRVRRVETYAIVDPTGSDFGLMVEPATTSAQGDGAGE